MMSKQIKAKQRVVEFGEVFTAPRQVSDMLNLIPADKMEIDTTFLEPACGNGNFIVEILSRKFSMIGTTEPWTFSLRMLRCIASVYGIDILKDNVFETTERIVRVSERYYMSVQSCLPGDAFSSAVRGIASRNTIWGNTVTATAGNGKPLSFHEWIIQENGTIISKEYTLTDMLAHDGVGTFPVRTKTYRWMLAQKG